MGELYMEELYMEEDTAVHGRAFSLTTAGKWYISCLSAMGMAA